MQELTFEQVEDVSGGAVWIPVVIVMAAAATIRGCERRDAAYVAEQACGEGNVESANKNGFTCKP